MFTSTQGFLWYDIRAWYLVIIHDTLCSCEIFQCEPIVTDWEAKHSIVNMSRAVVRPMVYRVP